MPRRSQNWSNGSPPPCVLFGVIPPILILGGRALIRLMNLGLMPRKSKNICHEILLTLGIDWYRLAISWRELVSVWHF